MKKIHPEDTKFEGGNNCGGQYCEGNCYSDGGEFRCGDRPTRSGCPNSDKQK